ncbi:DUF2892 domain-containing protein [Hoeflea sp. WL0058]|uniref:DUF2892 domain-containing protein n=1 Tax=Flavimaribacter sediminis TaxID=2865987 RepID=A0AAE2ZN94_9HYPH|nr:DUF2892 domain-containing protein [Flavimaribacter sediminis]MBW8637846.1 DUF2892 domain-containing protein [Flavimaribacter sediminis]
MSTNMGMIDRVLRLVIAAALLFGAFGATSPFSGALFWLAVIVAVVFVITALAGFCPLYRVIGLSTCRTAK